LVSYNAIYGTAGTQNGLTVTTVNASATPTLFDNDTLNILANTTSQNSSSVVQNFTLTITAANANFSLVGSGSTTTPTWADLLVIELPKFMN